MSLREACARFCPWFAKIICSPVSGTCLAKQSKPCANLALPCSTTAFSWGPATKRKCKTCQRHSNVTLILFCLLYLFGKCPYNITVLIFPFVYPCLCLLLLKWSAILGIPPGHPAGLHGRQRPQVAFLSQCGSHRRATGALGRDETLIFFPIGSMRLVYLTTFV